MSKIVYSLRNYNTFLFSFYLALKAAERENVLRQNTIRVKKAIKKPPISCNVILDAKKCTNKFLTRQKIYMA